jgi:hypothetical protein
MVIRMKMRKVVQYYYDKIVKMDFPSFYVYRNNEKKLLRLNESRNFCYIIAKDLHYSPTSKPLSQIIMNAARSSYWSKFEYEY